jgi:hypothetical protein
LNDTLLGMPRASRFGVVAPRSARPTSSGMLLTLHCPPDDVHASRKRLCAITAPRAVSVAASSSTSSARPEPAICRACRGT